MLGVDRALREASMESRMLLQVHDELLLEVPETEPGELEKAPAAVEWGVGDINAPEVWDDLGVLGDGIVVASIDTGVQYDHPALVNQYRAANGVPAQARALAAAFLSSVAVWLMPVKFSSAQTITVAFGPTLKLSISSPQIGLTAPVRFRRLGHLPGPQIM